MYIYICYTELVIRYLFPTLLHKEKTEQNIKVEQEVAKETEEGPARAQPGPAVKRTVSPVEEGPSK